jgi:NAD-dependent deacetylase
VTPVEQLAARIGSAARLTILTGAGVSAASGVPTFRGAEGLWRRYRPEELATPSAFHRDPGLVWEWYAWRRERIAGCVPNAAHHVIARWSRRPGVVVVTQNVDDLHLRAGTRQLIRLHGSIWEIRCAGQPGRPPCRVGAWRDERVPLPALPPRCPHCEGVARPGVVWFGESLDEADVAAAEHAVDCDVFLTAGTSAVVYPAAGLVAAARRRGAWAAEINIEVTPATSSVDLLIRGPAEEVLAQADALLNPV